MKLSLIDRMHRFARMRNLNHLEKRSTSNFKTTVAETKQTFSNIERGNGAIHKVNREEYKTTNPFQIPINKSYFTKHIHTYIFVKMNLFICLLQYVFNRVKCVYSIRMSAISNVCGFAYIHSTK